MYKFFILTLSTFFYVGYLPLMPGTFASIAAVCIFLFLRSNPLNYIAMLILVTLGGFLFSGRAERQIFKTKDARYIVIDEISGMSIALLPLLGSRDDLKMVLLALLFFRILDTLKPYPADRLQDSKGSLGIMSDDIVAGIYSAFALQIVASLNSLIAS